MTRTAQRAFAALFLIALVSVCSAPSFAQIGRQQGLVEPNVASEQELAALPHINAALAKGILERRPFAGMRELDAYLGETLSAEQRKELYGKLFIHVNLNTAAPDEIMLIPGMGRRMLREFQEYKPYKSLEQFRKEIGKYVNAEELARMEQYVFVPLNLNTASDEALQTIPGLGRRMLREFKEYRPYANIEQFRKEIGKYVNAKEVARLERYVTLE